MAIEVLEWTRIQELFHTLADRSLAEQRAELDVLARLEPRIADEVRGMLAADAQGASLLDRGIASAASDLLRAAHALPPHNFGPYQVERLLGEGGMGVVYLGHRADIDARAAIKVLPNAWISPARRERFRLETQTLATLSHPAIARLLDADHLPDGTPWFAMEYVEGRPITTWINEHSMDVEATLRLFLDVCDAVQHAHERAVIHRDIKPANILVTADGHIKLLDFGIAKRFRDAASEVAATRTTYRLLTPEYAAPEQLTGAPVGIAADVYALGVTLYEMLTGARPYAVANDTADPLRVIRESYPPRVGRTPTSTTPSRVGALSPGVRRDLDALLAAACAPEVADRYRTVDAFASDVRRFLAHEPLSARTGTWRYRTRKFLRRRWRGVAASLGASGVVAAGLAAHTQRLGAARDVALAEAARTTRMQQFLVSLFQGGPQGLVSGDSLRLSTIVQNGIREAGALGDDPLMQAELTSTLGTISEQIGNFTQGDSLLKLAVQRATAVYGARHAETYRARIRRAAVVARLNKADSALGQLRAVEVALAADVPSDHPVHAEFAEALGKMLGERGELPAAIKALTRAVALRAQRDTTSREYADALRELGNAQAYAGQWWSSDSTWRRAIPIMERRYGAQHPNVGFLLTNLGTVASMRGDLPVAERELSRAVEISAAWYGDHHWLTAGARMPLGQTLNRLGKFPQAAQVLRQVIQDYRGQPMVDAPGNPAIAIARNALGHALQGAGDLPAALDAFTVAGREMRAALGPDHMNTLINDASVAGVLTQQGRPDSAIGLLNAVIARAAPKYGQAHPEVAGFKLRLGRALFLARRYAESISSLRAGLRVLDSLKVGKPDDLRRALATLDSASRAVGDSTTAADAQRRLSVLIR